MALNLELLLVLLVEQEEAITTADRCRRQISRLLAEQLQRRNLEQTTTEAVGEYSAEPPSKRSHQSTQPEDTSDEDLLEVVRVHEKRSSDHTTHCPTRQLPVENTARAGLRHAGAPTAKHMELQAQATHISPTEHGPLAASNERP